MLTVKGEFRYIIYSNVGKLIEYGKAQTPKEIGQLLPNGLYLLVIYGESEIQSFKILKD